MFDQSHIRNFSIIAHIDHGKSTLADRLLEKCNAVPEREMENQLLDNMDLERERGITIKSRAVQIFYKAQDGETYALNLIDTPGHVDFNYEVSRSLAACEGALLVVDSTQGVEAQTLANTYLAMDHDLEILPVFNKIDLPAADPLKAKQEVEDIIGLPALEAPEISAKLGINIDAVLEDVVQNVPAPKGDPKAPLRALVFDSQYDPYVGVVVLFRIMEGTIRKGQTVRMMASGAEYTILECGYLKPLGNEPTDCLQAGDINNHHIADLLPAHEDHKAPEAVLRLQKNGGIITGENTVKDHGPHIAQHDAADEVGHEEHRAEQAAALNALGEGIGCGKGQYIDENQRHQREQARIPEGMHKAGILQCLDIVPQADELRVRSRFKLTEGQIYTFTERIDKSDNKSADHGPHKKWEPAPKRAADQRPADRCRAFLALQIDHSHQKIDCYTAQTSCGLCRDRTGEAGESPPLLACFRVSGFDPN